jgi:hypothetical protein
MYADRQRQAREQEALNKRSQKYWAGQDEEFRRLSLGNSLNKYIEEEKSRSAEVDDPVLKAANDARRRIQQEMEKNQAYISKQDQESYVAQAVEIAKAEQARTVETQRQKELKEEMAALDEDAQRRASKWADKALTKDDERRREELALFDDVGAGRISMNQYDQAMAGIAKAYAPDPEKPQKVKLDFGGDNLYQSRFATRAPGGGSAIDLLKRIAELLKSNDANQRAQARALLDWLNANGLAVGAA